MKEPKKFPLTDHPSRKEPTRIRLYPEEITEDVWNKDIDHENHLENSSQSIQKLETDQTD